jgi:hypothetical protein
MYRLKTLFLALKASDEKSLAHIACAPRRWRILMVQKLVVEEPLWEER